MTDTTTERADRAGTAGAPLVEILVTEPLDAAAASRLGRLLADAMTLHPGQLVVDLSDCPFVGAVALDVLLDTHRQLWRTGGRLVLRSPSPRLRRILEVARVDQVFHLSYLPSTPNPAAQRPPGAGRRPGAVSPPR